jgi:hypothetical protein
MVVFRKLDIIQLTSELTITARQYGEVVLPDEASGQDPDSLARKLSRCKPAWLTPVRQGGYGVVFANPGTSFVEAGRVAVQV